MRTLLLFNRATKHDEYKQVIKASCDILLLLIKRKMKAGECEVA